VKPGRTHVEVAVFAALNIVPLACPV